MTKNEETRYREFSAPFRVWLIDKFGTYKEAARCLNVSAPYLSQVLSHKKPTKKLRMKCLDYGFDDKYFVALDAITDVNIDQLTYEEIKFLYLEAKYMIEQSNKVISIYQDRIKELVKKGY